MKRKHLQQCAIEVAQEVENLGYAHWLDSKFPVTFERSFSGSTVQVEIQLLENKPNYLQLCVSVYHGGLSCYFPAGWIVVLDKPQPDRISLVTI